MTDLSERWHYTETQSQHRLSDAEIESLRRKFCSATIIADPRPDLLSSTLSTAAGPGLPGAPVTVNWNINNVKRFSLKALTWFGLLEYDALEPGFEGRNPHEPAGLVLKVVVGVSQLRTANTPPNMNTNECK